MSTLNMQSICPLPRWDQFPFTQDGSPSQIGSHLHYLASETSYWACFVNCSQAVTNNRLYHAVACLSTNNSFVYVSVSSLSGCRVFFLEPSCGYLATIPLAAMTLTHTRARERKLCKYQRIGKDGVLG
jgi:hypothetical protein